MEFDFGRGDAMPSSSHRFTGPIPTGPRSERPVFRKLAHDEDDELASYLDRRRISPGFLVEIDLFLQGHPELLQYAPKFVEEFNNSSPLHAYRHFLKGYTRPCRYARGVIPEIDFTLPNGCYIPRIVDKRDEELDDFFRGYEYRYDILQKIDQEALRICQILQCGGRVTRPERLLVSYHLWGQPADCYKWYEYNYQDEWLTHRYLPEHVVLSDVPKGGDYVEPTAHVLAAPEEGRTEAERRHRDVRYNMASACDQGVDVLDVLLDEFVAHLAKRGLTRPKIQEKRQEAVKALNAERANPTGKDIVDLVMGMANSIPFQPPRREKTLHFGNAPYQPVFPNFCFNFGTSSSLPMNAPQTRRKGKKAAYRRAAMAPKAKGVSIATRIQKRANVLRDLKISLQRIYAQEAATPPTSPDHGSIVASRRRMEHDFVRNLVPYVMQTGGQHPLMTTSELNRMYSKEYETTTLQIETEAAGRRRTNLLSFLPPELN